MGLRRRSRGVTIIEAMIVVAIVGVLAMLAIVAYRRWVRSAFLAEGQDMVSNIRTAEESYIAENGVYLDVSGCLGAGCSYPLQAPSNVKTAWGGACSWCKNPATGWNGLTVHPDGPVIFGYSVIADQPTPPSTRVGVKMVNGQAIDMTAMGNGAPWYFVEADANVSGDGTHFTYVYGMSGTNQLFVDGEGN
jgi:prepilin-type N-terminal cleavage/methylation domain-containing protein